MRQFTHLIFILSASFLLVGCSSYFETYQGLNTETAPPEVETVDLMNPAEAPFDGNSTQDLINLSNKVSHGSVEIFPLDGHTAMIDSGTPVSSGDAIAVEKIDAVPVSGFAGDGYSEVFSEESGIEVFPLDDTMASMIAPQFRPPGMRPPRYAPSMASSTAAAGGDRGFVSVRPWGGSESVVYFNHDSTSLSAADIQILKDSIASSNGSQMITVEGHASVRSSLTDPIERKVVNLKVSLDRAFAVARALIEQGIPAENIDTRAYGETRARPPEAGMSEEEASRRVEIHRVL